MVRMHASSAQPSPVCSPQLNSSRLPALLPLACCCCCCRCCAPPKTLLVLLLVPLLLLVLLLDELAGCPGREG